MTTTDQRSLPHHDAIALVIAALITAIIHKDEDGIRAILASDNPDYLRAVIASLAGHIVSTITDFDEDRDTTEADIIKLALWRRNYLVDLLS